jgi:hypothetical protein
MRHLHLAAGGQFLGSFTVEFSSTEAARLHIGDMQAGFKAAFASAEAKEELVSKVDSTQTVTSFGAEYSCTGWSPNYPPKLACSLGDLIEGCGKFDYTQAGKLEAVLRRYEDIDAYRAARAAYYAARGQPDTWVGPMKVPSSRARVAWGSLLMSTIGVHEPAMRLLPFIWWSCLPLAADSGVCIAGCLVHNANQQPLIRG